MKMVPKLGTKQTKICASLWKPDCLWHLWSSWDWKINMKAVFANANTNLALIPGRLTSVLQSLVFHDFSDRALNKSIRSNHFVDCWCMEWPSWRDVHVVFFEVYPVHDLLKPVLDNHFLYFLLLLLFSKCSPNLGCVL